MIYQQFTIKNLKNEVWKDIPEYEGLYQVSNYGRVKTLHGKYPRLLIPDVMKNGYLRSALSKNSITKRFLNHRLVLITFLPDFDKNLQCNHKNGIKTDNRLENLEPCTNQENAIHAVKNGLRVAAKGEKQGLSKLTEENVKLIKLALSRNENKTALAKKFKVGRTSIRKIASGETWKHIEV